MNIRKYFFQFTAALFLSLVLQANATAKDLQHNQQSEPPLALLYEKAARELFAGTAVLFVVPLDTEGVDQIDTNDWWKDCALSRRISPLGMKQAEAVREAITNLGVRVGIVESSELCIALSTATFVAGSKARIYPTPDLNPMDIQRLLDLNEQIVRTQLTAHFQNVWQGTVSILSGFPLTPSAAPHPVIADLKSGETAIFKPRENGEIELVARLNWSQWTEMSNYITKQALAAAKRQRLKSTAASRK